MKSLLKIAFYLTTLTLSSTANATDLTVGDKAPDFNLQATTGKFYKLSDYLGKQAVVIAWYPMANTRGCTIECKSLIDNGPAIREFDVSYFMVSVDPLDDNRAFAKETGADFPMLSDPTTAVAKSYDVLNLFGVASRVTFYVSKEGNIMKIDEDVTPKTAAEDMMTNLVALSVPKLKR